MKDIDPRSYKNPANWRLAYAAFQRFQALAEKLGEPASQWRLSYPDRLREKAKTTATWQLHYSLNGVFYDVYVGHSGETAAAGINSTIKSYPRHERSHNRNKPSPKKTPRSLIADASQVQKLWREWNAAVTKVGHSISPTEFQDKYKLHSYMLSRKAGILDMDMMHYLGSHPHAQYWSSPPQTEEEYRRRNQVLEQSVRDKEARERRYREEHPEDYAPSTAWQATFQQALRERELGDSKPEPEIL
jgi:hypothetical protein